MTINTDSLDIYRAIALEFQNGRDPFAADFLAEHDIQVDDSMQISNMIGVVLLAYTLAPRWVRGAMLATGINEQLDIETADYLWSRR